jgi:hypothetical protein
VGGCKSSKETLKPAKEIVENIIFEALRKFGESFENGFRCFEILESFMSFDEASEIYEGCSFKPEFTTILLKAFKVSHPHPPSITIPYHPATIPTYSPSTVAFKLCGISLSINLVFFTHVILSSNNSRPSLHWQTYELSVVGTQISEHRLSIC